MPTQRINFTKKALHEIKPSSKREYFYDEKTKGLILDVTASGSKSFYLYRKIQGRPERVFIGRFPETTVEQARYKAMEICSRIGKGENPQEDKRHARGELTLRGLFKEYIERHAKKKRKTWSDMEKNFDRYAASIAELKLSNITAARAEKLHQQLNDDTGPHTANRTVQMLRAVYNKGIQWKLYRGENPFKGISLFPERPRERFLTPDEVGKLLSELEKDSNELLRDFVKLSLLTGVRKSNLASMRWKDVDLEYGTWRLEDTKNGSSQVVPLGAFEVQILRRRLAVASSTEFVFPGEGATGHLMDIKKSWTRFRQQTGFEDVTIHDLRRSLGSGMASQNVNIALVKDALHHKDMKTTINVYARTRKDAVVDAKESVHNEWLKKAGLLVEVSSE